MVVAEADGNPPELLVLALGPEPVIERPAGLAQPSRDEYADHEAKRYDVRRRLNCARRDRGERRREQHRQRVQARGGEKWTQEPPRPTK
jgi:hypothetical protein